MEWVKQGGSLDAHFDIGIDVLKDMPDQISLGCPCCPKMDVAEYKDHEKAGVFENRWLRIFHPRMIQAGCCCSTRSQLFLINSDDLHKLCQTVKDSIEALETGQSHPDYNKFQM